MTYSEILSSHRKNLFSAIGLSLALFTFVTAKASADTIVNYNFIEDTAFETTFFGFPVASAGATGVLNFDKTTGAILPGSSLTIFNYFPNQSGTFDLTAGPIATVNPVLGPIVSGFTTNGNIGSPFFSQNFDGGTDAQLYTYGEVGLGFGNWTPAPTSVTVPESASTLVLGAISLASLCFAGWRFKRSAA